MNVAGKRRRIEKANESTSLDRVREPEPHLDAPPDSVVLILRPNQRWWSFELRAILEQGDLLKVLVRRDLLTRYRQTILGPLWFVLQPLVMALIFSLVFARAARIPTDGVPPLLFYLASLLGWNFFSQVVALISPTFTSNRDLFTKVYFPRLIIPLSVVLSNLATFALQLALFFCFYAYYTAQGLHDRTLISWRLLALLPLLVHLATLSLGTGLLIASFTGRYRDLLHGLQFLLLGWMFLTPVFMPAAQYTGRLAPIMYLNPVAPVVEGFREILLGSGSVQSGMIVSSLGITTVVLVAGVVLFQRVARTVVDTV